MDVPVVTTIITVVGTLGVVVIGSLLSRSFARSDKKEKLQEEWGSKLVVMQESFQHTLMAQLEVERSARSEEVNKLTTQVSEMQDRLRTRDSEIQELKHLVASQATEITRLSEILQKINPRATDKACVLFGTPSCPYGLLWKETPNELHGREKPSSPYTPDGAPGNTGQSPVI